MLCYQSAVCTSLEVKESDGNVKVAFRLFKRLSFYTDEMKCSPSATFHDVTKG